MKTVRVMIDAGIEDTFEIHDNATDDEIWEMAERVVNDLISWGWEVVEEDGSE